MKNLEKKDLTSIARHIGVWCLITIYFELTDPIHGSVRANTIGTMILMATLALTFYTLIFVAFPNFGRGSFLFGSVSMLLLYLICSCLDYLTFNYVLPGLGTNEYEGTFTEIIASSYRIYLAVGGLALAYFYNRVSIRKLQAASEREKTVLTKELTFLKSQFNSHITFNFLNYCYSKVHQSSPETADAIELFSDMLRSSLSLKLDVRVPVEEEITYIKNFIQLRKLLSDDVYVNMRVEGDPTTTHILPRLLITFVENAFTHGFYNRKECPIEILLICTQTMLVFDISNKKRAQSAVKGTGTGLSNIKQLLISHYREQHVLQIHDSVAVFNCRLQLIL